MTQLAEAIVNWDDVRDRTAAPAECFDFGPFSLLNFGEALYRDGIFIPLGSRARQILACLAARPGEVVSKAELMETVWPDTTVVENNLTVHITALRRVLGAGQDGVSYVINTPGRGYSLIAPARSGKQAAARPYAIAAPVALTNLPVRLPPAIGLARSLAELSQKLRSGNVVTVCGPAGVGKTTLALHAANQQRYDHTDGVWFVNLAPVNNDQHVADAVARAMGVNLGPEITIEVLGKFFRDRKALLVLDNCEHVIEAVATLASMIATQCPDVVLLATSRERLRISGEVVYDLAPLKVPPLDTALSTREALAYPAVELLVERILAACSDFSFTDQHAEVAGSICRRLDGVPLAIEFASTLVGAFGLNGLSLRLDDLCMLMQTDRRGGSDRHRTLNTALEWSYGLLEDTERDCLQRLATLQGSFTLESAAQIIGEADLGEVGALLAKLHAKSLIATEPSQHHLRFRLLQTTRAFALERAHRDGAAPLRKSC